MSMKCVVNVVLLSFVLQLGADAFVRTNLRGETLDTLEAHAGDVNSGMSLKKFPINWGQVGMGAAIGGLIAGAIVAGMMLAGGKKDDKEEEETSAGTPLVSSREEPPVAQTDYAELLKNLSKKVADDVGPKFAEDGCVRKVLESRMESFTDKAKNFLLTEMNGTAGAVMREMEAEESMLMLDWNNAVESNMPPAPILIAGVLSPTVINLMASHHFTQMLTVGLPLFILCTWAVYEDWATVCSIPTIYFWLYTQTVLAFFLFVGHGLLFQKCAAGRKVLQVKMDEVNENLGETEDGGFANLKEQFIGNTIILQEALMVENGVRHSIWNRVVGLATVAWLITTFWNLALIAGWTFVPGIVAFHPSMHEQEDFCGAWATVLALRISMLLSVLYLFLNLFTVVQWVCDEVVSSKGFSDAVLKFARKLDKNGSGVPIVEVLAKAFLLRGGDETIISRLAVVQYHKKSLKNKEAKLSAKLASLTGTINSISKTEAGLMDKAKDGGDLAAQVQKLNGGSVDYDNWKLQGSSAIDDAEMRVAEMGAANTEHLDKLYEQINQVMEDVKNSETVQLAAQKAAEAKEFAEQKAQEAYDKLNDPEFQQQMRDLANQASAQVEALGNQAKDMANDAIAMASDPELQRQLQEAAQKAMDQAKDMAEQAKDMANDPEMQKKLQEAMDQAQAKAMEAAATITDPELQKKMQENAQKALDSVQQGVESAAAAVMSPEMQEQLQAQAMAAVEQAQAAAKQAAAAATDPKIREAALAKLQEARKAAEEAAASATDPEIRKKFEAQVEQAKQARKQFEEAALKKLEEARKTAEEAAATATDPELRKKFEAQLQNAKEQALAFAEEQKEQAKQLQDQAMKTVEEAKAAAAKAAAAATDPKIREAALQKLQEARKAAEEAAAAATDPEIRKKLEAQVEQAKEARKAFEKAALEKIEEARKQAEEAAAAATDPETRKKFEAQLQKAKEQALAFAEEQKQQAKQLQDQAMKTVEEAQAAAAKAAAAATDPKIREAAVQKLEEARKAAEEAAAAAQDPETRKKFEEQAQKALEQGKAIAAEQGAQASVAVSALGDAAKDIAAKAKGKKGSPRK